ncbi:hypothetical protein [Alteribacter natronophilus]|uniref:hypothetical protein n=1 Tax=Alteribacter natronophilus TaxID=2583810 RepID=UPI00110EBB49|nr:hypothetical protein [Alteribacter natronophilus]TMW72835.1 hypothetical protein FGB90_00540 [Alteribacter natronophilus]
MIIEEKEFHIEPGRYTEMWITVYNAYDSREDTERYRVDIEDERIFNLIEEGEEYFMVIQAFKQDREGEFVYRLNQIERPEGTKIRGD